MLFTGVVVLLNHIWCMVLAKSAETACLDAKQPVHAVGGIGNNFLQMPRNELKYGFYCQKPAYIPRINF